MKIGLACGGTGGHLFPGLATADVLKARGHEVTLWLTGRDLERQSVTAWEGPILEVPAQGLPSGISLKSVQAIIKLLQARRRCVNLMRQNIPDVVLAMGSYASVGPLSAARRLRVPYVLHEANVLPGKAVVLFSRWAAAVAGCFEETQFFLRRKDLVLTGMPLRRGLDGSASGPERSLPGLDRNLFTVLVMGGSRGAHALNAIAPQALADVHRRRGGLQVIHLTGRDDESAVAEAYRAAGLPHRVMAFCDDMADLYACSDLAICRSGASTCAELSAFGLPALLVPYPFATRDHQMGNARAMEKTGAADVVPEKDLSPEWLADYLLSGLNQPGRLARMSAASRGRTRRLASEALADLVEEVGRGGKRS